MSNSTTFTTAVTQIPTGWANDLNRLNYDVLGSPATLAEIQQTLGLAPLLNGGALVTRNGSIDGSPIGANQPSTGVFTSLRVTGTNTGLTDVVTYAQLVGAVNGATTALRDMAYQDPGSVDITGGTVDGVPIGNAVPAPGRFTTLRANDPVSANDVVNIQTMNARFAALPSFGNMSTQNRSAVAVTGGLIDGTLIGSVNPVEGWFTRLNTEQILGSSVHAFFDGAAPGKSQYALYFDLISNAHLDLGFNMKAGAGVVFTSPSGVLTYRDGRLAINQLDDGIHNLQVAGSMSVTDVFLNNTVPAAANSATSKTYVDARVATVTASIAPAIAAAVAALGNIVSQDQHSINLTGGAIDGVVIGGLVPSLGSFTQVATNLLVGSKATLLLDGTGGYANSAAVLNASDATRPNISVVPNANGAFAVMAGASPVFRTHVNGRTVVGAGGEDGLNTLQVYGDAVVNGRVTFNGGNMTGTTTPTLGTTAPAMVTGIPIWVRTRVTTPGGVLECVTAHYQVQ